MNSLSIDIIREAATRYGDAKIGIWGLGPVSLKGVEIQRGLLRTFTVKTGSVVLPNDEILPTGDVYGSPDPTYIYSTVVGIAGDMSIGQAEPTEIIHQERAHQEAARIREEAARMRERAAQRRAERSEERKIGPASPMLQPEEVASIANWLQEVDSPPKESTSNTWIDRINAPYKDPDFVDLFPCKSIGGSFNNLYNLYCDRGVIESADLRYGTVKYRGVTYKAPGVFRGGVFYQQ